MKFTTQDVQRFYDHFGRKQDAQAFYEDAALEDLVVHAQFETAQQVFEFGCGTGRFAQRLIQQVLPANSVYTGIDLSSVMISLAQQRLSAFRERVTLLQSDGTIKLAADDHSLDRIVSTYVLDLLPESDIKMFFGEAHRALKGGPEGKLCLVSLTNGCGLASKSVIGVWRWLYRLQPMLLGGCRPLLLTSMLDPDQWQIEYHHTVVRFGVPSEILIVSPREGEVIK